MEFQQSGNDNKLFTNYGRNGNGRKRGRGTAGKKQGEISLGKPVLKQWCVINFTHFCSNYLVRTNIIINFAKIYAYEENLL